MRTPQCRCCGVPVDGMRAQVRVCAICDRCDGKHGDELQALLLHGVQTGQVKPGMALCRALVDDAHLTGRIVFVGDINNATITIPDPPPRWFVVCGRAAAKNTLPDMHSVIGAVINRHIPGRCSRATLDAIAAELKEALHFVDDSVMDVTVASKIDALDPQHLIIQVNAKAPVMGMVIDKNAGEVEIPADILSRARGQA